MKMEKVKVKIKKLSPNAVFPKYSLDEIKFKETNELETSIRGNGGYGSTGRF